MKEKNIIRVWSSPISPALEESYKFQKWALTFIIIGITIIVNILILTKW